MMTEKKYNDLNSQMDNLLNAVPGSKEAKEAVDAWELSSNETFYASLLEGFIYESYLIFDTLEFYIRTNVQEKVEKLVSILDTYYPGYIKERFDGLVSDEEYERCANLSKVYTF